MMASQLSQRSRHLLIVSLLLLGFGVCANSAETSKPITLGEDVMPGLTVAVEQTGLWVKGTSVQVHVVAKDDAGVLTSDSITVRSGSPGLPESAWGKDMSGKAGDTISYPVDAVTAAHTELYITVMDAGGNRMTSRFTVVR